jgi:hypothetical protein
MRASPLLPAMPFELWSEQSQASNHKSMQKSTKFCLEPKLHRCSITLCLGAAANSSVVTCKVFKMFDTVLAS